MVDYLPFNVGTSISYLSKIGQIKFIDQRNNLVGVYENHNDKLVQYKLSELLEAYRQRELSIVTDIYPQSKGVTLTNAELKRVEKIDSFCQQARLHETPQSLPMLEKMIPIVAEHHGYEGKDIPKPKTLQGWYREWALHNYDTVQMVISKRTGRNKPRLPDDIEDIIKNCIDIIYLKEKKSQKATIQSVRQTMLEMGYSDSDIPDSNTIRVRIKQLDPVMVTRKRKGELTHREYTRATISHHPKYNLLERVECDVMHLNIGVLDNEGYYIGSLSIAFCLDTATRAIIGYALMVSNKKKETASFVLEALLHSVIKKNDDDYPFGGIAHLYAQDNGPGYRDSGNKKFIEMVLKALLQMLPSRKGWGKPFVEAEVKSIRQHISDEVQADLGKFDSKKFSEDTLKSTAKLTIEQVEEKIYDALCYTYHDTPMEALKYQTPRQVWAELADRTPPIYLERLPNPQELRPILLENKAANSVKGVQVLYQTFQCNQLQELVFEINGNRALKSIRVCVEVNYYDARAINVIDPRTGKRIEVPNTKHLAERRSFYQLNAFRNGLRKRIENEATIATEKRIKQRAESVRKGPKTNFVPIGSSKSVWDDLNKSVLSPHELMPEHDKESKRFAKQVADSEHKQSKSNSHDSNSDNSSRFESQSKQVKKSGGFDAI
ncbi:hypothetical protein [Pseudoalteromonas spongiae]|uniref:hypothetical protein n=1 Tax=Pseudoalteromonas spongiae TaxID=298657 RepID=UPI000C2D0128|nr:hypothetical protein [Pseudoalteromonas spongiae]